MISVKEKLHEYIELADEKKIKAIYTLLEHDVEDRSSLYDDATLKMLQKTSDDFASGKMPGYSPEESMNRIRQKNTK